MNKPLVDPKSGYIHEVASAISRVLNAALGNDGSVTFSAQRWQNKIDGKKHSEFWVWFVDAINSEKNHCEKAWVWHNDRGLI